MQPDWIVKTVSLTNEARQYGLQVPYPFHVTGINLSDGSQPFSWTLTNLKSERYDLSGATYIDCTPEQIH